MSFVITQRRIFPHPDAVTADQLFDQNLTAIKAAPLRFHLTNHINMLAQNTGRDRAFILTLQERLHNLQYAQLRVIQGIKTHSDFSC